MTRVTLTSDELAGFRSDGFDDHVKLIFPAPGEAEPRVPTLGPDGPVAPPPMRDFTPRRYDPARNELIIDFALHEAGPATEWADRARPGDRLAVGGPRGSFVIADDFDWYLLAGDESALPAIGRRLEELRPDVRVIVLTMIGGPEEELLFESRAEVALHWVHRPLSQAADFNPLLEAMSGLTLPEGDGFAWIAGESLMAKATRQHLIERGLNKSWIKAAGYWRQDAAAVHDKHED